MDINTGEILLADPPLISCCMAQLLADQGLVLVCDPGVGDPWCKFSVQFVLYIFQDQWLCSLLVYLKRISLK